MKTMKKIAVCASASLLFACFFAACQTDAIEPPELIWPSSMTFADDPSNPGRVFTIKENLEFSVEFVNLDLFPEDIVDTFETLGIVPGVIVVGEVDAPGDAWTNLIITGIAGEMRSYNSPLYEDLDIILGMITIDIRLNFTVVNHEITSISVVFPAAADEDDLFHDLAVTSTALIGGTFHRVAD